MTGTGTQAEPYIVDNWADFLTVCEEETSYIKWADSDNKIIDFNDVRPDGYNEATNIYATVDFNGWTLKNYRSRAATMWNVLCAKISNLTMIDILHNSTASGVSTFRNDSGTSSSTAKTVMRNCIFTGKLNGQSCSVINNSGYSYFEIYNSQLNFDLLSPENRFLDSANRNALIAVDSNLRGNVCGGMSAFASFSKLENCLVNLNFTNNTYNSDIYILNSSTAYSTAFNIISPNSNGIIANGAGTTCVYNADLIAGTVTHNDFMKPCTSEQYNDISYLQSVGFPSGVV